MLRILDKNKTPLTGLVNYKDLCIESVLELDDKTLSFSIPSILQVPIVLEGYIETKEDRFVIKEVTKGTDGSVKVVAQLDIEGLEGNAFRKFESEEQTIKAALQLAFAGSGWTVGECEVTKKRTIRMTNTNAVEILKQAIKTYRAEIKIDSKKQLVHIYKEVGEDRGAYFTSSLNLKQLNIQSNTYDFCTELEPYGKDGLSIENSNNGKNYVSNYQYSAKKKRCIWKDERYTDATSLKEDAEAKLADMSKPYTSYSAAVIDLSKLSEKYSILDYGIGDTVTLLDSITGTREKQRIGSTTEYPDEPNRNTCTLANKVLTFDELAQKYDSAADTVDNITNDNGQVDGDAIDGIYSRQVIDLEDAIVESAYIKDLSTKYLTVSGELTAVKAEIGQLKANQVTVDYLNANYATIQQLTAIKAEIEDLEAEHITVEYLDAHYASIDKLDALEIKVNQLDASQITTDYLEANFAEIDLANIEKGCITTAMIGNGVITSAQIADSSITDAKIVDLTANKITAGTLSVERLIIRGSTNSLVYELNNITGALQSQNVETLNGEILTDRTITADKIVAKSITAAEIASRTITANEILAGTITANEIAASAITTIKLDAGAVTAAKIAAGTITATQIAANAITADKIASKAITADKINVTDLYAIGAKIGGMVIASNKIYGEINSGGTVWGSGIAPYKQNQYSLWVGETNQAKGTATTDAPFRVSEYGTAWIDKLYAGNSLDLYESNASWKGNEWNVFRNDCTWNIKQNHHQYGDLKLILHPWDGETQLVFNWCSQNHGTVYLYGGYNSTTYVGLYHAERNGGSGGAIWKYQTDGNFHIIAKTIAAAIECTTLTQTSTIRAKKNYKVLKPQSALEAIKKTQIYSYTLKGYEELGEQLGVIIEKECPEQIVTPERDAINLYSFISLVANAVRELAAQVDAQSSSVALLEKALQKMIKEDQNVRNN